MNCVDLETLLCDYVDGTLDYARKADVERHLAECPACAQTARDAAAAVVFIERAAAVEPPPELITRIVFDLTGGRAKAQEQRRDKWAWLGRLVEPVLQPRFAMGMAMTILSFAMLARLAGINVRQLSLSDVDPVKVWRTVDDRAHRAWNRTVKFYDNLQSVYEIRTRLRQLTEEDAAGQTVAPANSPGQSAPPSGASRGAETPEGTTKK
jgi:anti-sigma factor RsiW